MFTLHCPKQQGRRYQHLLSNTSIYCLEKMNDTLGKPRFHMSNPEMSSKHGILGAKGQRFDCLNVGHVAKNASHFSSWIYTPENSHDNGKTNHLKMYLLLKIMMFHCHFNFRGILFVDFSACEKVEDDQPGSMRKPQGKWFFWMGSWVVKLVDISSGYYPAWN